MKLTFQQIKYHRNGIAGEPFHAIRFRDEEEDNNMLGIVFDANGHVAVFDLDSLGVHDIGFSSNSWMGDTFESLLRKAIKELEAERIQP